MAILIFGLIVFLGIHSVQIVNPGLRAQVIAKASSVGAWKWPYTGLAIIGLFLIILGYSLAKYEAPVLYYPSTTMRHLAIIVMLPVFPLLLATYIKGRIKQLLIHPMLIATALWSVAHLMANGSLADLLLFGSFLVWAVLDWRSLLKREASSASQTAMAWSRNDIVATISGLVVYVAFVAGLHAWLFGVSPV